MPAKHGIQPSHLHELTRLIFTDLEQNDNHLLDFNSRESGVSLWLVLLVFLGFTDMRETTERCWQLVVALLRTV